MGRHDRLAAFRMICSTSVALYTSHPCSFPPSPRRSISSQNAIPRLYPHSLTLFHNPYVLCISNHHLLTDQHCNPELKSLSLSIHLHHQPHLPLFHNIPVSFHIHHTPLFVRSFRAHMHISLSSRSSTWRHLLALCFFSNPAI